MKSKEEYLKAVDNLLDSYDAYYIANKYDEKNNTHKKEFKMLIDLFENSEMDLRAIQWIHNCYDCYYKSQYENDEESPFAYLKKSINRKFDAKDE
mgnify:FL=1